MLRWSTTGVESLLRRIVATLLGMAMLGFETFLHEGDARWPILWAGLALTFGPSVLSLFDLFPRRMDPPAPEPPSLPPSPTGQTGDRS